MASRSLNRIELIGNLTRDPELKYTPNGVAVCTFSIATNRSWSTATGEIKEDVQFHRLVAWQKLAELCAKLLTKGRKVYAEGRITYRSYMGKDNTQKYITEIVLNDFILFDDKGRGMSETEGVAAQPAPAHSDEIADDVPVTDVEETHEAVAKKTTKTKTDETDESVDPDDIPF